MRNKIRMILLVSAIGLLFSLGYVFKSNFKDITSPVNVSLGESGVDISIENFNVTHEELGEIIWELKAESAKINSGTRITQLSKIELIYHQKDNKLSYIFADSGTLNEATKDFDLMGNVRLISNANLFKTKIR